MNTPAFPHFDGMSNNDVDIFRIPRVLIRKASLVHEPTDSAIFCFSTQTIWRSGCRGHGGETWGPLFSISEACAVRIIWTSCLRHRTGSEDFDVHPELEIHLAYSVPAKLCHGSQPCGYYRGHRRITPVYRRQDQEPQQLRSMSFERCISRLGLLTPLQLQT